MIEFHVLFVLLLVGTQALFTWLDVLNLRHGERTVRERSEWVTEHLEVEDTEELLDYNRAATGMSGLQSWVVLGVVLLVLYSGVFAAAVQTVQATGLGPLAQGVVFLVGAVVALAALSWPFDVVNTFVVEEIFGFNQQSPRLWIRDTLIELVVSAVLVAIVGAALLWVILTYPTLWWVAGAVLFLLFALVMQVLYPRVIAPLFYDFHPIDEGELRGSVEDVFDRAGFTCEQIYEMNASTRSSHSNAYFVGFGRTKRVVLFDTLIEQMKLPELESILAHELAHWKRKHVWKQLLAGTVQIGVLLAVVWWLMDTEWLYAMFGVPETAYAGLVLALVWISPLNDLLGPLSNRLSLAHEREADRFAVEVMGGGDSLAGALGRLAGENLMNPFPHPWYAAFHYSHPPIPDRIRYVQEYGSEGNGGRTIEEAVGE